MGEITKIGWTHRVLPDGTIIDGGTFNGWFGCAHASEGCKFCYAEEMMDTRWGKVIWGNSANSTRVRTSPAKWGELKRWNAKAQKTGLIKRVFISSLSDVFEDRPELTPWRNDLIRLWEEVKHLNLLVLTKRPENIGRMIEDAVGMVANEWLRRNPHIWLGTSVESQKWADVRVPALGKWASTVRFLSVEPMLSSVDLRDFRGLFEWVIIGGESGIHARPFPLDAAIQLVEDSVAMRVPVYFKQVGTKQAKAWGIKGKGEDMDEWPIDTIKIRQWPD